MKLTTPSLGLIVLGILLLGAQLVLYLGVKTTATPPNSGEVHMVPKERMTPLPGILGIIFLVAGFAVSAKTRDQADDPRDGRSVPNESDDRARQRAR